jgi:hypothetical protein
MIGLISVVMGSMMASPAWAITVDSVADIYEDQPVGLVVDGLAANERVRVRVTEDDGTIVLFARGRSVGGGSMTFYGMLPNITEMVDVVVITNLGSMVSGTFDVFGVCDETGAYDLGYADGGSSVDTDSYYEAGVVDGAASAGSTLNCFQSSFCFHANLYWGVTQSESIHGNGGFADVEAECLSSDPGGWNSALLYNASGVTLTGAFGGSWSDLCAAPS